MKALWFVILVLISIAAGAQSPAEAPPAETVADAPAENLPPPAPLFGPGIDRPAAAPPSPGYGLSLTRYLATMGGLLGLFGLSWWGLKRWRSRLPGLGRGQTLQIAARLTLDPRHSLVLVRLHGEEVLLGLSPDQVNLLSRYALLDDDGLGDEEAPERASGELAAMVGLRTPTGGGSR